MIEIGGKIKKIYNDILALLRVYGVYGILVYCTVHKRKKKQTWS